VSSSPTADPFVSEIIRCRLLAAAEDMRLALIRSAYSSILYEMEDCAVALLDRNGEVLAQSSGLPRFLGNLEQAVKESVRLRGGEQQLRPGDVVCLNDSYIQGTHLEDVTVFSPIFWRDDLVGFAAARAHLEDVGGRDPGGGFITTEIYEEGLRLGPVRIVTAGEANNDILDIVRRNSRFGDSVVGDLHAMIAACRTGEKRLGAVLDRFGLATFYAVRDELFRQSEEVDRRTVASIPDGTYTAEGFLDNDGVELDKPVRIHVAITISGDTMHVNFAGTSAAVKGALNCGVAQAISSVRVAYFMLLGGDRAPDGGSFRNLHVTVPEGTFLHAREPSACEAYASSSVLLMDLIVRAFAPVLPARVCAGQFGDALTIVTGTRPDTGARFVLAEAHAGGWGAAPDHDGADGVIDLTNGRLRNMPIEILETKYPIRVLEYGYRSDSGGAGRNRGGCGVVRRYLLGSDAEIYYWLDRNITPAWGLFGGRPGQTSEAHILGSVGDLRTLKVNRLPVKAGDEFVLLTGGGGGYGDPRDRPVALVRTDVEDGFLSAAVAAEHYPHARDQLGAQAASRGGERC
jgi:N-methylhydantoinase B